MQITITLSLPHKCLRPNARSHWAPKSRAIKQARQDAQQAAFEKFKELPGPFIINHYFLHPFYATARFWDDDNIIASCKSYRDGIADVANQDDRSFRCAGVVPEKDSKNPRLEIIIDITLLIDHND